MVSDVQFFNHLFNHCRDHKKTMLWSWESKSPLRACLVVIWCVCEVHCFTEQCVSESLLLNAEIYVTMVISHKKKKCAKLQTDGVCRSFIRRCCSKRKAYWTTLIYQDLNEAKLSGMLSFSVAQYCCRTDKHVNNVLTDTLSPSLCSLKSASDWPLLFFMWMYFRLLEELLRPWIIFHIRF